jgi:type IV secretory pathway protease TraF
MSPNYNDGDWLLFHLFPAKSKMASRARGLVGKVVLIQRQSEVGTDFLQVKRVTKVMNNPDIQSEDFQSEVEIWVEGDNKSASTDSRSWGALNHEEVIGKLIFRYRRAKPN